MKKLITAFLILILCVPAALPQQIRDIDETVVLHRDGSAEVTQVWDVNVVSGTEFYLPFDHLGPLDITDLQVSEGGVPFVSEGDGWDTDRSREQKRGRCGIVRKPDGVELCWGQGDYGDHVWTVSYSVKGLVMQLDSCAALYFSFVNPGLVAPPQHVKVVLVNETGGPAWTPDNVQVWGFGSDSEIFVEDGAIRAESLGAFGSDDRVTALVRFDEGLFAPAVQYDESFEKLQKRAFRGSDYTEDMSVGEWLWLGLLLILGLLLTPMGWVVIAVAVLAWQSVSYYLLGNKYKKRIFGRSRIKDWYRGIPLKGSLPAAYYTLVKGCKMNTAQYTNNLIGAYFLRWVLSGHVGVLPDEAHPDRVNLSFPEQKAFDEALENDLYLMVREASGSNHILEAGELDRWAKRSFRKFSGIPDRARSLGKQWYVARGYMGKGDALTPDGQERARQLIEFKNFLEDFTLSDKRGAIEVTLWEDYLVFAALFGIADRVAKQFEKLYPSEYQVFTQAARLNTGVSLYRLMRLTNSISASAMQAALAKQSAASISSSSSSGGSFRSSGGGGSFSRGGGGHSFGGSRGGGSR